MITKRIIPCLDIREDRVVKGVSFVGLQDVGDPVELAVRYDREGADELVVLNISGSEAGWHTGMDRISHIAKEVTIPFTVGGGVTSIHDMDALLTAGADKVSIGTAAVLTPKLVEEGARYLGSPSIVVAIDARFEPEQEDWFVYTHGGRRSTPWRAVEWANHVADYGAGEILLTSMDQDGRKDGYDLALTKTVADAVGIPVIASGGAGEIRHFSDLFTETSATAALAASIFHYGELSIPKIKDALVERGVNVRVTSR